MSKAGFRSWGACNPVSVTNKDEDSAGLLSAVTLEYTKSLGLTASCASSFCWMIIN